MGRSVSSATFHSEYLRHQPARVMPRRHGCTANARPPRPFRQCQGFAATLQLRVVTPIALLLGVRGPGKVLGTVVKIVIAPFDLQPARVTIRQSPRVERARIAPPLLADRNPATAVSMIVFEIGL